ncbi:MAG: zinc ribbon domain-containing protein [Betaproteobacteria bacterium]|nr:zinc ribbon domain-containing protein [Betaproteobacteria bacterium]MCL2886240.1 zinc ribbon domain-containing protein [Betaproteobacteria bacterium]
MVRKHPCPECGANLEWNAKAQSLKCPYCGAQVEWSEETREELGREVVEQDLDEALRDSPRGWGAGQGYEVQCQNCHAISVFLDRTVAQRCDFCGSPAIVAHEARNDAITPQSILPFKVSDGQIRDRIRQWYGSRWFAPNKFKTAALTDTLHGVYLPYWTFDAHAAAQWQAEAGYYYTTTVRDGNGRSRQVRQVRWEFASGSLRHFFDDELVPGTVGVPLKLLRQIEPFPTTTDLKPYSPEFVRGWTVERYQIDLAKAAGINEQDMDAQLRTLCARQVPGDTQRNLQVQRQYSGRTFKHILAPVWLVGYTYGRRNYQIIANGYTGQVAGERPYSWVKIAFAVLAALMLIALLAPLFLGN